MVCLACLLPIFLIPVVNALPLLFFYIKGKIYALLGWEYRKPERVPPACPYNPSARKDTPKAMEGAEPVEPESAPKPGAVVDSKED